MRGCSCPPQELCMHYAHGLVRCLHPEHLSPAVNHAANNLADYGGAIYVGSSGGGPAALSVPGHPCVCTGAIVCPQQVLPALILFVSYCSTSHMWSSHGLLCPPSPRLCSETGEVGATKSDLTFTGSILAKSNTVCAVLLHRVLLSVCLHHVHVHAILLSARPLAALPKVAVSPQGTLSCTTHVLCRPTNRGLSATSKEARMMAKRCVGCPAARERRLMCGLTVACRAHTQEPALVIPPLYRSLTLSPMYVPFCCRWPSQSAALSR